MPQEKISLKRLQAAALLLTAASTISAAAQNLIRLIAHYVPFKVGLGLPIVGAFIDIPIFIYCQYVTWKGYQKEKKPNKILLLAGLFEGLGLASLAIVDLSAIFFASAFALAGPILVIVAFSLFTALALKDLGSFCLSYAKQPKNSFRLTALICKVGAVIGCLGVVATATAFLTTPLGLPVLLGLCLGFMILQAVTLLSTPVQVLQPAAAQKPSPIALNGYKAPLLALKPNSHQSWITAANDAAQTLHLHPHWR